MTPGARLAETIELLEAMAASPGAADDVAGHFFRHRRHAGSHDRRAMLALAHLVQRHRAPLDWWRREAGLPEDRGPWRARAFAALALTRVWSEPSGRPWSAKDIELACDGTKHAPPPLGAGEAEALARLERAELVHGGQPLSVRASLPEWIEPYLERAFGERLEEEALALAGEAPLDLRVNALQLKAGEDLATLRERARAALAAEGVVAAATRHSPLGLRVEGKPALGSLEVFRSGLVEVQDEGSQLVALIVGARPGERVVDFCAGAGGKTLALSAAMQNTGRIIACDVSAARLARAVTRLRRAGAHDWEQRLLRDERDPWVKRHAGGFDRVLVDAPCTGTGAWRRNPDSKWSLTAEDVASLADLQDRLLASACRLVRPGGRLVHATCSVLFEENEDRIERFLATQPDFVVVPQDEAYREALGTASPAKGTFLRLSPASLGVDGFFAAVLARR